MRPRRGLTLLEVLASAVLLAAMAAACVPLLRQAMRDSQVEEPSVDLRDLADFADVSTAHGPEVLLKQARTELPWPDSPDRAPVVVERLRAEDSRHAWLAFRAGTWTVFRWVEVPTDETSQQERQLR